MIIVIVIVIIAMVVLGFVILAAIMIIVGGMVLVIAKMAIIKTAQTTKGVGAWRLICLELQALVAGASLRRLPAIALHPQNYCTSSP